MRTLSIEELDQVGGGADAGYILDSMRVGGEVGAAVGFVLTETIKGATRGGLVGAAAGLAWGIGFYTGTVIYETFCR